jgi:hypothetical protein
LKKKGDRFLAKGRSFFAKKAILVWVRSIAHSALFVRFFKARSLAQSTRKHPTSKHRQCLLFFTKGAIDQKRQKSGQARKSARNRADYYIFSSQIKKNSREARFLDSTGSQKN